MTVLANKPKATHTNVGMGQIALVTQNEFARAILGSCIGVAIYHPRFQSAAVAHIVLAKSEGRSGMLGKFADTAIPEMLRLLADDGVTPIGLCAKLAGGANMFGSNGPIQVGEANHEAVKQLLQQHKVRVVAEHVGGNNGRRITFNPQNKEFSVEIAGREPERL